MHAAAAQAERAVYEAVVALLPTFHAEFVVTRAHLRALAFLVDARLQVRGDESSKVARAGLGLSALTKASTLEEREKAAESAVKELILEVLFRGWIVDAHAEASSMASFGLSSMVPDFMWKVSKTCRELSPQLNFVRRASGLTARGEDENWLASGSARMSTELDAVASHFLEFLSWRRTIADPAVRERWSLELHAEDVKMVADPCTLNHTDQQQEDFVQQSLSLWRGIFDDFWLCAAHQRRASQQTRRHSRRRCWLSDAPPSSARRSRTHPPAPRPSARTACAGCCSAPRRTRARASRLPSTTSGTGYSPPPARPA